MKSRRRPLGLYASITLSWVPLAALVVGLAALPHPDRAIVTHWNFNGQPDGYAQPGAVLPVFIGAAVLCGVVITGFAIAEGPDLGRRAVAVGFGITSAMLGAISGLWFLLIALSARHAELGLAVTSLVAAALLYGTVVALSALVGSQPTRGPTS